MRRWMVFTVGVAVLAMFQGCATITDSVNGAAQNIDSFFGGRHAKAPAEAADESTYK